MLACTAPSSIRADLDATVKAPLVTLRLEFLELRGPASLADMPQAVGAVAIPPEFCVGLAFTTFAATLYSQTGFLSVHVTVLCNDSSNGTGAFQPSAANLLPSMA